MRIFYFLLFAALKIFGPSSIGEDRTQNWKGGYSVAKKWVFKGICELKNCNFSDFNSAKCLFLDFCEELVMGVLIKLGRGRVA